LRQRRNQKWYWLDSDKKLQPGGALGTLVLVERRRIVWCKVMRRVPADVRMHASCAVVTVVVVVEVRVQQRRTQRRQLQCRDRANRDEGPNHPPIVVPKDLTGF
jgi:hypothetical protein